jgi:hypothetical protein
MCKVKPNYVKECFKTPLPMESVGYVVYTDVSKKGLGCVLMQ